MQDIPKDKKTALEIWKIDSIRYTISFPLFLIFLVLLRHWNYNLAFWIFFGLIIIEYIAITYKMNKQKSKLLN